MSISKPTIAATSCNVGLILPNDKLKAFTNVFERLKKPYISSKFGGISFYERRIMSNPYLLPFLALLVDHLIELLNIWIRMARLSRKLGRTLVDMKPWNSQGQLIVKWRNEEVSCS